MTISKIRRIGHSDAHVGFWCPGCDSCHVVRVLSQEGHPCWSFNGSDVAPTFTPSVLVNGPGNHRHPTVPTCHSFVTDGRIQFLGDCTHAMAGQTVDLPDFPDSYHTSP